MAKKLKVVIRPEEVFGLIDCSEDAVFYNEVLEEYREIESYIYSLCEPVFLMEYGVAGEGPSIEEVPDGTPLLMVLTSIGRKISQYSTKSFSEGDYLKGMLADAMADVALFSLEEEIVPYLRKECCARKMGISRRLEIPRDIPVEAQKVVFELTNARERCDMKISSGYMIDPVKSNVVIYVLTKDRNKFLYRHDCGKCECCGCKVGGRK